MSERIRPRDLAFLTAETASAPLHNATIEIFEPGDSGFDYDSLVALILDRISFVPRYRQRVRTVPGRLAKPVWGDDEHFDIGYHVRRSALPRPGTNEQLRELVARIVSRPLDRHRPLWEIYFVEGLEQGPGGAALQDPPGAGRRRPHRRPRPAAARRRAGAQGRWSPTTGGPARSPSPAGLVVDAIKDSVAEPSTLVDTAVVTSAALLRNAGEAGKRVRRVAAALSGRRPERTSPISGPLSQQRRVVTVDTKLADHRKVREAHGGTVNDVVLATVAGGLRAWLMTRVRGR